MTLSYTHKLSQILNLNSSSCSFAFKADTAFCEVVHAALLTPVYCNFIITLAVLPVLKFILSLQGTTDNQTDTSNRHIKSLNRFLILCVTMCNNVYVYFAKNPVRLHIVAPGPPP